MAWIFLDFQLISNAFTRRKRRLNFLCYSIAFHFCRFSQNVKIVLIIRIREGSNRVPESTKGSDSWVDEPITRHIISLCLIEEEKEDNDHDESSEKERNILWPIALHTKGLYSILFLPLVEPREMKDYVKLCRRSDCGPTVAEDLCLSSLLLSISSITGAFMVAHAFGDIISGETVEPEVVVSASPSVGGLFDSLTGNIGISSRAKPVAAPVASASLSGAATTGATALDAPRAGSRLLDRDLLRYFITTAMPLGALWAWTTSERVLSAINGLRRRGCISLQGAPHGRLQGSFVNGTLHYYYALSTETDSGI